MSQLKLGMKKGTSMISCHVITGPAQRDNLLHSYSPLWAVYSHSFNFTGFKLREEATLTGGTLNRHLNITEKPRVQIQNKSSHQTRQVHYPNITF